MAASDVVLNTLEEFQKEIESIIEDKDCSVMDAVMLYCEQHGVEVETAAELVKKCPVLKAGLQTEAEELHFLKKRARLPV